MNEDKINEILNDIKERMELIIKDNNDPLVLFKDLKSSLINSYMRNDFRISVLKKYASYLLAIIVLEALVND